MSSHWIKQARHALYASIEEKKRKKQRWAPAVLTLLGPQSRFGDQITDDVSGLSPKRDCGSKSVWKHFLSRQKGSDRHKGLRKLGQETQLNSGAKSKFYILQLGRGRKKVSPSRGWAWWPWARSCRVCRTNRPHPLPHPDPQPRVTMTARPLCPSLCLCLRPFFALDVGTLLALALPDIEPGHQIGIP